MKYSSSKQRCVHSSKAADTNFTKSLVWSYPGSNPQSKKLEASTLTITQPMRFDMSGTVRNTKTKPYYMKMFGTWYLFYALATRGRQLLKGHNSLREVNRCPYSSKLNDIIYVADLWHVRNCTSNHLTLKFVIRRAQYHALDRDLKPTTKKCLKIS